MPNQQFRFPIFLVVMTVIGGFLSYPTKGYALSCFAAKTKVIAVCHQGFCDNGFLVERIGTGNSCGTRPIVRENIRDRDKIINPMEIFLTISKRINQNISSGIYELETKWDCVNEQEWWNKIQYWGNYCEPYTTITKLSDSTDQNVLQYYKGEWQTKEQEGLRAVTVEKWRTVIITIAIVFIAIAWPWIILLVFRALRRHILLFILFSIVIQIWIATDLLWRFMWSYSLLQDIATVSVILLYLTSFISALYVIGSLIHRKFRKI